MKRFIVFLGLLALIAVLIYVSFKTEKNEKTSKEILKESNIERLPSAYMETTSKKLSSNLDSLKSKALNEINSGLERMNAIEKLGLLGSKKATDVLTIILEKENNSIYKRECLRSLGRIKDKKAINSVINYFYHKNPTLKKEAAYAIYETLSGNENIENIEYVEQNLISLYKNNLNNKTGYESSIKKNALKALTVIKSNNIFDVIAKDFSASSDITLKREMINYFSELTIKRSLPYLKNYKSKLEESVASIDDPLVKRPYEQELIYLNSAISRINK